MAPPILFGIVNITEDSFSDGGAFLAASAAVAQARKLLADGAEIIDLGPAASNPDALAVPPDEEIRRLDPVITALTELGAQISIDSFLPETQRYALSRGVAFLNDIQGFPDAALYPALASAACKLIVMHSVQRRGSATRRDVPADDMLEHILRFFEQRLGALERAGVARERIIIDPGMGYFLSTRPETSLRVLANLSRLKGAFGLPILVSVSRKSFLRVITGRAAADAGHATLAAEICAALAGADYIRTHDAAALRDGLRVLGALASEEGSAAPGLPGRAVESR
jgi:dihydropteroate synthase type 2